MCVVSMVGDYYKDRTFPNQFPNWVNTPVTAIASVASKEDIARLEQSILELKALLLQAIKYDEKLGEPHCEQEDKVKLIKDLAKIVGVDMSEVFDS